MTKPKRKIIYTVGELIEEMQFGDSLNPKRHMTLIGGPLHNQQLAEWPKIAPIYCRLNDNGLVEVVDPLVEDSIASYAGARYIIGTEAHDFWRWREMSIDDGEAALEKLLEETP